MEVGEDDGREEGPDGCREGKVGRERRHCCIPSRVGNPACRIRAPMLTEDVVPALVSSFVEETAAELKVFSMRA